MIVQDKTEHCGRHYFNKIFGANTQLQANIKLWNTNEYNRFRKYCKGGYILSAPYLKNIDDSPILIQDQICGIDIKSSYYHALQQ
jgi:hypothetical protein